ncbi:unnamed protein product [marine sediment metagenome]|uniref:Uncharacterized protein n=1 Tax=marine sediment metagenome TaxID=412755 RepID=X1VEL5_9ZZZZ
MSDGEFKKKLFGYYVRQLKKEQIVPSKDAEKVAAGILEPIVKVLDEAKKDLFECFGGTSYSGRKNGFVPHVSDEVELVLRLKKWFGDNEKDVS